ncbi:hypothetical protein Q5M85_03185 [Paraclostridium bifermentans]|nr:hypothetical protein [Paraclostridium bifermentans]
MRAISDGDRSVWRYSDGLWEHSHVVFVHQLKFLVNLHLWL